MNPDQQRLMLLLRGRPAPLTRDLCVCDDSLPAPRRAVRLPVCRLQLIVSGQELVQTCQRGAPVELLRSAGSWIFLLPHAWDVHDWHYVRNSFGIVFHEGFTRFLTADFDGRTDRRALGLGPDVVHHSPRPLPADARALLNALQAMGRDPEPRPQALAHTLEALLCLLERELALPADATPGRRRWQEVLVHLQENAHLPIDRASVARSLGLHPASVSRLFTRFDSAGFSERLTRFRLERACRLLADPERDLTAVARDSGFSGAGYFAKVFRKAFGETPATFRARTAGTISQDPGTFSPLRDPITT